MINKGDSVTIELNGRQYTGTVLSANDYGSNDRPNWYIELTHTSGPDKGHYGYWKQEPDGGKLVKVNGITL